MIEPSRRAVGAILVLALLVQTGCGTIMYPERRGQKGGRVDVRVAILDGIGLIFFIIPGVIAYAVDFGNGAIYLPPGAKDPLGELKKLKFNARRDGPKDIERLIRENTGLAVKLDDPAAQAFELNSVDDLPARFAAVRTLAAR